MNTNHHNWHTHHFCAMGCQMTIWLEQDDANRALTALKKAEMQIASIERCLTRFDEASELSRLNARTAQWVTVSDDLWDVIALALELAHATDGLFDPTVLNAICAAGYTHSFDLLQDNEQRTGDFTGQILHGRWQEIQLDAVRQAIRLPQGVGIDLGGIGKGWTAQKIVAGLNQWGACLVDAGGDLTAGKGPADWPGWPVGIAKPSATAETNGSMADEKDEGETVARLWLCNAALATSGIDYRQWLHNGQKTHHLIDPRTGHPADTDLLTVSILAADASAAEAWATAALIAGKSHGYQLLQQQGIAAACIGKNGNYDAALTLTPAMAPLIAVD